MMPRKRAKDPMEVKENDANGARIVEIPVDEIMPNKNQPRKHFEDAAIERLAESIRRCGLIQPITVRRAVYRNTNENECKIGYELISGERRLRATIKTGNTTIPCIITNTDEETSAELALVENLLREDLNCFEEAEAIQKLIENFHLTQIEAAIRLSMSQSAVANKLRLLSIPEKERKYVIENGLTERHARALLRIQNSETRKAVMNTIICGKLNVSETEKMIERVLKHQNEARCEIKKENAQAVTASLKSIKPLIASIRNTLTMAEKCGIHHTMNVVGEEVDEQIEIHILLDKNVSRETNNAT